MLCQAYFIKYGKAIFMNAHFYNETLLLFFQEGPHSVIKEDEFFDAIDASLDKLEKEEEDVRIWS